VGAEKNESQLGWATRKSQLEWGEAKKKSKLVGQNK